ncbi:adenylate/guanylate cyclase domain-containing protein [Modestobacter sp. I12A-02628]|uniref:Adenylate/guanylate cyclase domain-containing protein n=1 Tax=Goekera deserti TaxID=2497753 RepID=A0A7K3W7L8_9ACTN|nr:adenylate/guanylate cyclase domain-containing protein [Goekera deserti]MPQ99917.1 adenylate/guanylate cyclase domain-containing protein [Goekera deserti]NDI50076.1 adenylate/guanylate cyclase domain-containing protein [Goekera deserti]NEL52448.1 adenylate/guanylate cyclase domain-containing protein [Goekera deserti]
MSDPVDPRDTLEQLLLGGPRRYTRQDVAALSGVSSERSRRLWRALGFPDVPDDEAAFTDADVAALSTLSRLISSGFVDADAEASIARAMGQSLSRLADWQTDMLAAILAAPRPRDGGDPAGQPGGEPASAPVGDGPEDAAARAAQVAELLVPLMRNVQDHIWRRHLAANVDRLLVPGPGTDVRELSVGFADLVGYTSRSRGMGGRELGRMVEDFESLAADVIARHRGRVVKTVGDGVLFTAEDPVDAAEIALDLPVGWAAEDRPPLRVGLAHGRVLTRLGDVYSPVVNLASRLTSIARPGAVLADQQLARRLRGRTAYRVRPLRRVSVRGYDNLRPWLVRRRSGDDDTVLEDLLDEIARDVLDEPVEAEGDRVAE